MIGIEKETEEDAAFAAAEEGSFLDTPLNAYSYKAERAALALGLRFGTSKVLQSDIRTIPNPQYSRKREIERLLKHKAIHPKSLRAELRAELEKLGEQPPEMDVYDGIGEDAALMVFVRTLKDSELREVRSRLTTYSDRFEEWVEANGLRTNGPNVNAAIKIFVETIAGVNASRSTPILPEAKGGEDSPNG